MVVLLEGPPISTEELWSSVRVTIGFFVTSLNMALLPGWLSLGSLGGSKHLPFKNDGGHCVLGDLQCFRHVQVLFPRSVPRHNPVSTLRTIPSTSWLGFCIDMHCQLWDLI